MRHWETVLGSGVEFKNHWTIRADDGNDEWLRLVNDCCGYSAYIRRQTGLVHLYQDRVLDDECSDESRGYLLIPDLRQVITELQLLEEQVGIVNANASQAHEAGRIETAALNEPVTNSKESSPVSTQLLREQDTHKE
jgi:hypothetical protein